MKTGKVAATESPQVPELQVPEFDPYIEWLEIDPARCPPNYYDLLGLAPFESDVEVIEQAAEQRLTLVRSFQTGPRGKYTQDLLNELTRARITLLDPASREAYEQSLRGGRDRPPVSLENLRGAINAPPAIQIQTAEPTDTDASSSPRRFTPRLSATYLLVCVVLVLGIFGFRSYLLGPSTEPEVEQDEAAQSAEPQLKSDAAEAVHSEETKTGIMPGSNNTFLLDGTNAVLEGKPPMVSDAPGGKLLEQWQAAESTVRWDLWIEQPGYYEAMISYNATTNDSDSRLAVQVDDEFPRKTNLRTADQPSRFFEEERVVLFRKPGQHQLRFFVEGAIGDFRLRSIELRPNRTR